MGICIAQSLKEKIDHSRGDIPRSRYISKILEQAYSKKIEASNNLEIQVGESRRQPVSPATDSVQIHHGAADKSG